MLNNNSSHSRYFIHAHENKHLIFFFKKNLNFVKRIYYFIYFLIQFFLRYLCKLANDVVIRKYFLIIRV